MTYYDSSRRVGRSQAASIFWGLISVFFAAAACYYYWKDHEHETSANVLRDQVLTLQEQRETLNSQKDELQSNISETESQLKTREDFLNEKEQKLAQEESQLDAEQSQTQNQSQQNRQAVVVKKFNDAARKLVKDDEIDVVVRGGRPVLRVPSSVFFAFGDTTLKPEGKAMLKQIAQALDGELDNFELRIETFTDGGGENTTAVSLAPPKDDAAAKTDDATKKVAAWVLTGERAGVLAQYIREQTSLPFQNVLVVPRSDFQPIIPTGAEAHARNRRIEITITPQPVPFHPVATPAGAVKEDHPKKIEQPKLKSGNTVKSTDAAAKPKKENDTKSKSSDAAQPKK